MTQISARLNLVDHSARAGFSFLQCYTVLMRANQLETAVHGCRILLILGSTEWSLSCRCRVRFSTQSDQPCRNLSLKSTHTVFFFSFYSSTLNYILYSLRYKNHNKVRHFLVLKYCLKRFLSNVRARQLS